MRKNGLQTAHITTETANGPFWRFYEKDLLEKFSLTTVWEYYWLMFRAAYSVSAQDGSVMILQMPSVNTQDATRLNDDALDTRFSAYLNANNVPTFIDGDM